MSDRKLKILCLHAFRTNADIFSTQLDMTGQRQLLEDLVEFVLLDAPHVCTKAEEALQYDIVKHFFPSSRHGSYREWINGIEIPANGAAEFKAKSCTYAHLDDTIKLIGETLASASPPFDGIMGFSQGGSMAAMTIAMQQVGDSRLAKAPKLKFAWIQSSRIPRDPSCLPLFDKGPITLPCFFSVIEDDKSVLAEESRALISKFSDVTLVSVAKGGHGPSPSPKKPDQKENANKLRKWLLERKDAIAKEPPEPPPEPPKVLSFIESPFTTKVEYEKYVRGEIPLPAAAA